MDEERFGHFSSTDDGNTLLADIPSGAVSSHCRHGLVTLSDDNYLGVGRDSNREPEATDDEDGVYRTDVSVEEDMISLELEPEASEGELLLKPVSP